MTGAMILFGSSLFFLYALPRIGPGSAAAFRWPRPLLMVSGASVLVACILGFFAQTAVLAGSLQDALQPDAISAAAIGMSFGQSSLARAIVAALFLLTFRLLKPPRAAWWHATLAGGVICASFAWMGHGAASKGAMGFLHLASDILHTLAAGVWIGALVAFLLLVNDHRHGDPERRAVHSALHGFSGVGSALVAVLLATGLINGWFVVGLAGLPRMLISPYGRLLTLKLVLFVVMVGLAAANRFRLTPALAASLRATSQTRGTIAALRRSLGWESAISIAVLGLVAWFGTLAPPAVT